MISNEIESFSNMIYIYLPIILILFFSHIVKNDFQVSHLKNIGLQNFSTMALMEDELL